MSREIVAMFIGIRMAELVSGTIQVQTKAVG